MHMGILPALHHFTFLGPTTFAAMADPPDPNQPLPQPVAPPDDEDGDEFEGFTAPAPAPAGQLDVLAPDEADDIDFVSP